MTSTGGEVQVVVRQEKEFESDLLHFICCEDENYTYCGMEDGGWDGEYSDEVDCVVCNDLGDDPYYCPKYDSCINS